MKHNIEKLAKDLNIEHLNLNNNNILSIAFAKEADEKTLIPIHRQYDSIIIETERNLLIKYNITALRGGGPIETCKDLQVHGAFKSQYFKGDKLRNEINEKDYFF